MNFCHNCGNQLKDDMKFCQVCGTKVLSVNDTDTPKASLLTNGVHEVQGVNAGKVPRKAMLVLAGFFAFTAGNAFFMSGPKDIIPTISSISLIFLLIAYTPKGSKNILGKSRGLTVKNASILLLAAGIVVTMALTISKTGAGYNAAPVNSLIATAEGTTQELSASPENTTVPLEVSTSEPARVESISEPSTTESIVQTTEVITSQEQLSTVLQWYRDNTGNAEISLINTLKEKFSAKSIKIKSSKFLFGTDGAFNDCHYSLQFTCVVDGFDCFGEARAFVKYKGETINWWHLEFAEEATWTTLFEHYDEKTEAKMEEYYNYLVKTYK